MKTERRASMCTTLRRVSVRRVMRDPLPAGRHRPALGGAATRRAHAQARGGALLRAREHGPEHGWGWASLSALGLPLGHGLPLPLALCLEVKSEADARFREGSVLAKARRYSEARTKFLQAYALDSRPSILLSLAIVEHAVRNPVAALGFLRRYLATTGSVEPEIRSKMWPELWSETGHLKVRVPKGAVVKIDGQLIESSAVGSMIDVLPGSHVVSVDEETRTVSAAAGETTELEFFADAPSVVAPPPPPPSAPAPAEPAPSTWRWEKTAGVATWAASALAFGAGAVLLNASGNRAEEGREATADVSACSRVSSPACDEGRAAAQGAQSLKTGGWVAIAGGGALAVGGAVLFFWPKREASSSAGTRVEVRGTGLALTQRF